MGIEVQKYECHKNWEGSSSSMEMDIIVEEFREADSKYGLRYTKFIGDRDSPVYSSLITGVPQWGHVIAEIEVHTMLLNATEGHLRS